MDTTFWKTRWQNNQIAFHQEQVNPYLKTYWSNVLAACPKCLTDAVPVPVFVPLCGKSIDMLWLHDALHPVVGVEVSSIAVQDFFRENYLAAKSYAWADGEHYIGEGVEIFCGDFFALQTENLTQIGAVYDRASLIAFPENMRQRYVEHLHAILPDHAPILLLTLEYDTKAMPGPPFSVTDSEIQYHFAPRYSIEKLTQLEIITDNPRFQKRGLDALQEKVFLLHPNI